MAVVAAGQDLCDARFTLQLGKSLIIAELLLMNHCQKSCEIVVGMFW